MSPAVFWWDTGIEKSPLPPDSNGKRPLIPISPVDDRHLSFKVAPRPVKDLVGVTMLSSVEAVVRMGRAAVMGVSCHFQPCYKSTFPTASEWQLRGWNVSFQVARGIDERPWEKSRRN